MRIGDVAGLTGVSVRALRYYEEQGLLTAERTSTGQRAYGADALERVRLLRRLYNAGLNSTTIAAVLPCVDSPSEAVTVGAIDVMRREHARIGEQIAELTGTRDDLAYLINAAEKHHESQVDGGHCADIAADSGDSGQSQPKEA